MAHVFLSYVRENEKEVDRLSSELIEHGIKVWLDRNDIKPGIRWKTAIRNAIMTGDYFLACFSKEYALREKTYMNEELTLAIEELRKRPTDRSWFIPVLISECEIPDRSIGGGETLNDIQCVQLYRNWQKGIKQIADIIEVSGTIVKLLVGDDTEIGREGIEAIVETSDDIQIIGKAKTPQDVVKMVQDLSPNVLIVDLKWFGDEKAGHSIISRVKTNFPYVKIIAVTAYEGLIREAREAGADVGITRSLSKEELFSIIRGLVE